MAEPLPYATASEPPSLSIALRSKLSIMMFLQYGLWGAWWVVLNIYLGKLGFSGIQIGAVYGTTAIASIFSPIIFGQIADRWIATEYLVAFLHLVGALMLYLITQLKDFNTFYIVTLVWALLYMPTISLTNSLSMHNIPNAAKYFPGIRVFGTIGWIVAGLIVGKLDPASPQPILLAAILSAALGLFAFTLPHTPPTGKAGEPMAFTRSFSMLKEPSFLIFMIVSFLISIVLSGYYAFTAQFLDGIDIDNIAPISTVMTLGQISEMLLLPLLPFFLSRFGMKWTLVIGMAAWGIRYAIFSMSEPPWLVIASLTLHGLCYDFFFVAAYIHVDNKATPQIRASAQGLFNLVVMGVGMLIGNYVFGALKDKFTTDDVVQWDKVWLYPTILVVAALAVFIVAFREKRGPAETSETQTIDGPAIAKPIDASPE